jgi:hypothetical protein
VSRSLHDQAALRSFVIFAQWDSPCQKLAWRCTPPAAWAFVHGQFMQEQSSKHLLRVLLASALGLAAHGLASFCVSRFGLYDSSGLRRWASALVTHL